MGASFACLVTRNPEVSAWCPMQLAIYPVWETLFSILASRSTILQPWNRRRKPLAVRFAEGVTKPWHFLIDAVVS